MDTSVRVSLTRHVGADAATHQILDSWSALAGTQAPNQHLSYTRRDTEDHLYRIMERHDSIASFSVFVDDLVSSLDVLSFMRDQCPKKEIRVYWMNRTAEGVFYGADDLCALPLAAGPDTESVFDVISSLTLLRIPDDAGVASHADSQ